MKQGHQRRVETDWVLRAEPAERHTPADAPFAVSYNPTDISPSLQCHMHEDLELGICMSGRSERQTGGAIFAVTSGDIWLCGMWEPHAWRNEPGFSAVHFYFSPQGVASPFRQDFGWMRMFAAPWEQRPKVDSLEMREAVLAIGAEVARECWEKRRGWRELGWAGLVRLLVLLERAWSAPEGEASPLRPSPSDVARVHPALALVQAQLDRHVPAEEAAAACDLSPSRFRTVFRQAMGISYGKYSVRTRVASAASRLLADDAPVDVVAHQTGFTDRSYLARMFAAFYGCSPSEFRRRSRDEQT